MSMKDIYPIQLTGVKATLLNCDGKLVLVDTGRSTEDAETILKFAQTKLNMPLEKHFEICVITHRHGDHIGGLKRLKETCNFKIASHVDESEDIESATGFKVEIKLKHKESLPYCGGIQFIHVPGHTLGNICLYMEQKKLLIVGDTVFADEDGNMAPPPDRWCIDPEMAKRELKRLRGLEFDNVIIGHGKDSIGDAKNKFNKVQV